MSKKTFKNYADASQVLLLRYPIPATFGVPGMTAVIQQALHKNDLPVDTTIVGFTPNKRRLTMIYLAPDGSTELVKRHCGKHEYAVDEFLSTGRVSTLTERALHELLTVS